MADYGNTVRPGMARRNQGARILAEKGNTEGELTLPQKSEVLKIEAGIRNRKTEVAYTVNDRGESTKITISSSKNRTRVNGTLIKEGDIVVHNHPAFGDGKNIASRVGISLSDADIMSSIKHNAKGVRASYPTYQYSLTHGGKGWGVSAQQAGAEWRSTYQREQARISAQYNRQIAKMESDYRAKKISVDDYNKRIGVMNDRFNAVASHRATKALADKYGWKYTRRKN